MNWLTTYLSTLGGNQVISYRYAPDEELLQTT